jgi:hypothetical protein
MAFSGANSPGLRWPLAEKIHFAKGFVASVNQVSSRQGLEAAAG